MTGRDCSWHGDVCPTRSQTVCDCIAREVPSRVLAHPTSASTRGSDLRRSGNCDIDQGGTHGGKKGWEDRGDDESVSTVSASSEVKKFGSTEADAVERETGSDTGASSSEV